METHRLGDIAFSMVEKLGPALRAGDMRQLDELEKMDDQVDVLQQLILDYLGETHKQELTEKQGQGRKRSGRINLAVEDEQGNSEKREYDLDLELHNRWNKNHLMVLGQLEYDTEPAVRVDKTDTTFRLKLGYEWN
jgi:hypothetical protein